jgi:hypothetical protein
VRDDHAAIDGPHDGMDGSRPRIRAAGADRVRPDMSLKSAGATRPHGGT